ncbi:MAG: hypothetical protein N4A33_00510 [Bacteriovoracaceae bacterium]|nr:hypothetical protein [Bacteriovoracaceae bacterium]
MKKLISTIAMSILIAANSFACNDLGTEGFLPNNSLKIPADAKSMMDANLDEKEFNAVIDKVIKIYEPIISTMGGELVVERKWEDGTVNAYAQQIGSTWKVSMFGGLARHEAITSDGFALVVCHEIGHHIGGAPKKKSWWSSSWASNEGQADYFATLKCLRRTFRSEDNAAIMAKVNVPKTVVDTCAEQFSSQEDRLICQRGSMAGMSTAKLFQALRSQTTPPDFNTPDANVVTTTNDKHPATQCRLDTYYTGALCQIDELTDVDQKEEATGTCYRATGDTVGVRPLCWFTPKKS